MTIKDISLGLRVSAVIWGSGRIYAIDKLNEIVYIEWDAPWSWRTGRKRAHHLKWVQDHTTQEQPDATPEAV